MMHNNKNNDCEHYTNVGIKTINRIYKKNYSYCNIIDKISDHILQYSYKIIAHINFFKS